MGRVSLNLNLIAPLLTVLGLVSLTVGAGMVFLPAAPIIFGMLCLGIGLFGVDVQ